MYRYIERRMRRWTARVLISIALGLLLVSGAALSATIDGVRLWRAPDHTRLVFDLSGPVEHKVFALNNPDRLVIDLARTSLQYATDSLKLTSTPIKGLRSAARNNSDLRIVLDLTASVKPRSFLLKRNEQYGDRLVVDLYDGGSAQTVGKTVSDVVTPSKQLRDVVIVIDPGHGGEDPGAIGPNRLHEKKVVLAISREVKRLADREPGYSGILVRGDDYYVPLVKRPQIARQKRADVLVSIHADAFHQASANGASVYALSRKGATSETARYLAQRENRADLIGGAGTVSLNDKDEMLAHVLLDLSMTATLDSSLGIGDSVLKAMGKVTRLHKRRVEQARFVVLKSPDIPSILVETGFISNPTEAQRLNQPAYQRKMAQAIFQGIKQYFDAQPPIGTLLASRQVHSKIVHVISRGDTLSEIAQQYRVSMQAIQSYNNLKSTNVRVGQRIVIPLS